MRNPKCRAILAHFLGKQNWQNRRTQSVPRVGPYNREASARPGIPAGAVDIDDFDLPAAVAGEAVLLKCMRRASVIRARNSWIGGSALPSHKSRAGNNRRDKRGSTGRRRENPHRSTGACHAGATTRCAIAALSPVASTKHCRGCFEMRAERREARPATIERAQCRLHRTRQIERLASTMARRVARRDRA